MTSKQKDLARRLIEYESGMRAPARADHQDFPVFRVCEKLRHPLSRLAGSAGFRSLLSRALALASGNVRWLKAFQIAADGSLERQDDTLAHLSPQDVAEGEVALVAQLIGLLMTFIGEGLTMQLLYEQWPDVAFDDRQR